MTDVLHVSGVTKRFGGLAAVSEVELRIAAGELVGLIGPNGAGKTTAFNLLTGVYEPTEGNIEFQGRRLNGLKPYQVARLGVARTFQNVRLFRQLTALQNVKVAAHLQTGAGLASAIFRTPALLANDRRLDQVARDLLAKLDLTPVTDTRAGDLAYGLQRRLEIARAMATNPKLLLLDEPAAGMNPQEKHGLMQLIRQIRDDFGLTILLIEHDMKLVMGICERIYVLDYGKIIAEGAPVEIRANPKVIAAYLGQETEEAASPTAGALPRSDLAAPGIEKGEPAC